MAKTQQRFELYGGPLCGDVVEREDVRGIHTLYAQPEGCSHVHVYVMKRCLPILPNGKKRRTRGFFYQGVETDFYEEDFEELPDVY